MKAVSSIFNFADRSPLRRRIDARVEDIPVLDIPLPPVDKNLSAFIGKGQGPWQRKAKAMNVGQSLILARRQADCFKSACNKLGYRVAWRSLENGQAQVQIVSKPPAS